MKLVDRKDIIEVEVGENDVVVLETQEKLTALQRLKLQSDWERAVESGRVIILDAGVRAKVIRNARVSITGDDEVV
jgi:hypothetical protein